MPEKVAENFGASFQENQFQVKIYITRSINYKQRDNCETKSQIGNELCWQKRHWMTLVLDLKLHQEYLCRRLTAETSFLITPAWWATKLLKLRPHKKTAVLALKKHEPVARTYLWKWFLRSVHDRDVHPQFVFLFSEACFSLIEEVNSHSIRLCGAENTRFTHEVPLHDVFGAQDDLTYLLRRYSSYFQVCEHHLTPFSDVLKAIRCFPARFCNSSYSLY